jgi:hypothetical protein
MKRAGSRLSLVTNGNAVLTVPEVADLLRVGKAAVCQAIERGDLRAARFG